MSKAESYDLDFAPRSYWGPQSLKTHFGSRIKGDLRRSAALHALTEGCSDTPQFRPTLTPDEVRDLGAQHPWLMGGEYLPDLLPNEVEIARVTMKSTTRDVISIRARKLKRRIVYRIVDEYMEEGGDRFKVSPKTSSAPLTMKQIIDIIQANELVDGHRQGNYEVGCCTPEEIFDFCRVSSAYYPDLARWYDEENRMWLEGELAKRRSEDGK